MRSSFENERNIRDQKNATRKQRNENRYFIKTQKPNYILPKIRHNEKRSLRLLQEIIKNNNKIF